MSRLAAFALRFTGSFLLSLALLGCQTPSDNVGSGQLILPSGMTAYVQEYLDEHNPAAFAVSQDGRCGRYRYCPTPVGLCLQEDTRYFAVKACESLCKRTCKVLLDERRVVWNGTVVGLPGEVRRPQDKAVAPLVPLSGKKNRPKPITSRNTPVWQAKGCPSPEAKLFDGQPGVKFRDCPQCPEMVTVPPATYRVGPALYGSTRMFEVTFPKAFAVGKYEVTFAEWDACVANGGCNGYKPNDRGWGRGRQPVIYVDWHQAQSYVTWLSTKTGGNYRLLSDSEWEYVARAGACTTFWWGDEAGTGNAVCKDCGSKWDGKSPAPVGQSGPNAFGLYDTAGNVSEWVEDCSASRLAPADGSAVTPEMLKRPKDCTARQMRGGSWKQPTEQVRPESTETGSPIYPNTFTGFRVAKTLP